MIKNHTLFTDDNIGNIANDIKQENIPYRIGSFWSSKQRQGHSLHEISYRACFKPQLVEYIINNFSNEGDVVLDPFMGRGTTVIEAALRGRIAYGSDINPLSTMLALPRLSPPSPDSVLRRLKEIPNNADIPSECLDLLVFFHKDTLKHLIAIKEWLNTRAAQGNFDDIDGWIRMVVLNRLTGHSKGFLSVRTMPPNQAVSIEKQKIINKKNNSIFETKDVIEIIMKKTKSLLRSQTPHKLGAHKLKSCSADNLNYIDSNEVDLLLTSPPFLDVVNYAQDNWMRCWFGDIPVDKIKIDIHRNVESWKGFVHRTFSEFARVVKSGGTIAFEVGEVRNGKIKLDEVTIDAVKDLPFRINEVIINKHNFTKTSNCWGVKNNAKGTLTNRIVIAKRV